MPDNFVSIVIGALFGGIWLLAVIRIVSKALRYRLSPVTTVEAVVVDKHTIEHFSKYSGNGKSQKYVVAFLVDGKKKAFYVSQFSYGGYRVNQKGKLKYKGDRLIDFS